jgi:hypothetical protein
MESNDGAYLEASGFDVDYGSTEQQMAWPDHENDETGVRMAYEQGDISLERAAQLLDLRIEEMREMARDWQSKAPPA